MRISRQVISYILDHLRRDYRFNEGGRILLYHSIGKRERYDTFGLRIPEENFVEQMEYLYNKGYNVIGLPSFLERIQAGERIDFKTVVITFDDGYKDIERVIPVIKRYRFPITLFVNCHRAEKTMKTRENNYWTQWEYISLEDLKRLSSPEIYIGSHSLYHRRLIGERAKIYQEIMDSKDILEQSMGEKVTMFSYPYGIFSDEVKEILSEAGYVGACSSITGVNSLSTDIFELRRTEITADDTIHEFERKLCGYYDWLGYFHRKRYYIKGS